MQDSSCIAIADLTGIKIYSLETRKICYQFDVGAVSLVEMLYCTSLMAFAGAGKSNHRSCFSFTFVNTAKSLVQNRRPILWCETGEQPFLTPRKLTLMNTSTQTAITELSYASSVLAIRMSRKRCVALL
jgi:autophagy-related protein 18